MIFPEQIAKKDRDFNEMSHMVEEKWTSNQEFNEMSPHGWGKNGLQIRNSMKWAHKIEEKVGLKSGIQWNEPIR